MGKYRYNRYRDLEIDVSRLDIRPNDRAHFEQVIKSEYDKWASKLDRSRERFTAVMWLNVAKSISHVVPWLIDMHYEMHHATTCRIMFVRVHPDSRGTAQIPSYGTHYVKVEPGDFIFGDNDGVQLIPQGILDEVLLRVEAINDDENDLRQQLASGMPIDQVYRDFGVL